MRTARCIALVTGFVALGLSPAAFASPTTITDTTATGATVNGAIGATEYAGSSDGVGAGFGGVIGAGIKLHVDSDVAGNLFFGLEEPAGACAIEANHVVVIYVDAVAGAGITNTSQLGTGDRTGELHRAAIAGIGTGSGASDLAFAPDAGAPFGADYAIAINGGFAGLWTTTAVSDPDLLPFVKEVTRTPTSNGAGDCQREYSGLSLADFGLAPGDSFRYVATLIDATSGYRSSEFQGVVNGNGTADGAFNIGANAFALADGDYDTFSSYAPEADLAVTLGVDNATPVAGGDVLLTVQVANTSLVSAAANIVVTVPLPAGLTFGLADPDAEYDEATGDWTIPSLAANTSTTLYIYVTTGAGTGGSTLTVTATRTASTPPDPAAGNDAASVAVTPTVPPTVDLQVALAADTLVPAEGDQVTLTVTVTNTSLTNGATGVAIDLPIPTGLSFVVADAGYDEVTEKWNLASLASGASASIEVLVTADTGTAGSALAVTATRTASTPADPNAANDAATVTVSPVLPAGTAIVVTVLNDLVDTLGTCSLREAILAANNNAAVDTCPAGTTGLDIITFAPALFAGGPQTLLLSPPPNPPLTITSSLAINGPGAATLAVAGGDLGTVMRVSAGAVVAVRDLALVHGLNTGSSAGGADITGASAVTFERCAFEANSAHYGGALRVSNASASVVVSDTRFQSNAAPGWDNATGQGGEGSGGAIYLNSGTLTVARCAFVSNIATGGEGTDGGGGSASGGAIRNAGAGTLRVVNSTFVDNLAVGGAGDTGAGGNASGGALAGSAATLTCDSCTFLDNRVTAGLLPTSGAATASTAAGATLRNSIVTSTDTAPLCSATVSAGFNLFASTGDAGDCNGGLPNAADVVTAQLRIGALGQNGGPTPTVAPRTDSPALDAGSCVDTTGATLTTDQRGEIRPFGAACDIGAYEGAGEDPPDDYGDAPAPYPTLLADNGARHALGALILGTLIDADFDGLPSAHLDGDNADGLDDEDGVSFPAALNAGSTVSVDAIVTGGAGFVSVWLDLNQDGDWDDAGERVVTDFAVIEGLATLSVPVPATATVGVTAARVRLNGVGGLAPTGYAVDGEVEDYEVTVIKCGDAVVQAPEACDDGDVDDAAGCKNDCSAVNTHWECPALGGACACAQDWYSTACDVHCLVGDDCNGTDCKSPSCNATTGSCDLADRPVTTVCDDADLCTQASHCDAGVCVGTDPLPLDCDDTNVCTTDYCNPATGTCANDPVPNAPALGCSDSDGCTLVDLCVDGVCVPGAPKVCDDTNVCTINACNSASGDCEFPADVPPVRSVTTISIAANVTTPRDVTVHETGMYVADSDRNIERYDLNGQHDGVATTLGADPTGIAATPDGRFYAITATAGSYFGADGSLIRTFGAGGQDIALAPDDTVVVVNGTTVQRFTPDALGSLATFTGGWSGSATALAVDPRGNIFVAASGVIYKYSASGTLATSWNGSLGGAGTFSALTGVEVDDAGRVYATEATPKRFQRFTNNGVYVDHWAVSEEPLRAAFGPSGALYLVRRGTGYNLIGVHYVPVTVCDDASSCTGHDVCSAAACLGGGVAECGDGAVCASAGEACDDGGTSSGDGCSAACGVEAGATCDANEPTNCTTSCAASCSVFVDDSFGDASVPGALWTIIDDPGFNPTDEPDGVNGRVTQGNGDVKFQNRGFLVTNYEVDPNAFGHIAVRSTWKVDGGDQARVHVRSAADQSGEFGVPSSSVVCVAEGGTLFLLWPTSPVPPPTTDVPMQANDIITLVVTDDGTHITCRFENLTRGGTGYLAADYATPHAANYVVFTNKNGPSTPAHTSFLRDARIEAFPGPCTTLACLPGDTCGQLALADGTTCDDDDAGTVGTTCDAGVCTHGCGDGQLDPGEACDTGSLSPADGCNATCAIVAGWQCFPNGLGGSVCDRETDLEVTVASVSGSPVYAGNTVTVNLDVTNVGPVNDTNIAMTVDIPGDFTFTSGSAGCLESPTGTVTCSTASLAVSAVAHHSLVFTLPISYTGSGLPTSTVFAADVDGDRPEIVAQTADNHVETTVALAFCGDDTINGPEQCDDGAANADASAKCRKGTTDLALRCKLPICNDGITDSGTYNDGVSNLVLTETCDDHNSNINDACPSGPQGTCKIATCGDGYVNITVPSGGVRPSEDCDSTGQGTFPGCAGCLVQAGWTCDGLRNTTCQQQCGTFYNFATSPFSWTPATGTTVFSYGASTTFTATGWETALSATLPATPVQASMWRAIAIPSQANAQRPQLLIDYKLDGVANSDCLEVYLTTKPDLTGATAVASACTPTAAGHLVIELSGVQAPSAQTGRVLTLALDATASAAGRKGLIVTQVSLRSDADGDGVFEMMAFGAGTCADPCTDVDGDHWGNATSANRTAGCSAGATLDCNDNDAEIKPAINEGAYDGSLACIDNVDNNCDGDTDAADAWCYEDCGNFVNDGRDLQSTPTPETEGDGLVDCHDPNCETDAFCTTPCLMDWTFTTGGAWKRDATTDISVFKAPSSTNVGLWTTAGTMDATRKRARIDLTLPSFGDLAIRGPKPTLKVRFQMTGNPVGRDVFAVCVDVAACEINLLNDVYVMRDTSKVNTFPLDAGWIMGSVDLSPYLGRSNLKVTLLLDTVESSQVTPREIILQVDRITLGSDVDGDGAYEGTDPQGRTCDRCWDGDGDGWGALASPDVTTCPQTPTGGVCAPHTTNADCVDCDDTAFTVNPGQPNETICGDSKDNDCNGLTDGQDGFCGSEDCANGADDNGDGIVDCADATCAGNPACATCYTGYDFEAGHVASRTSAGFVPYGRDSAGTISLFEWGSAPGVFQGEGGWWTAFNANVTTKSTNNDVRAWLVKRQVVVGSTLPEPAVELVYDLHGAAGVTFGVCFDVPADGQGLPSTCRTGAAAGVVAWSTTANTPSTGTRANLVNSTYSDGTLDRAIIPIPRGTHDVVIFFEGLVAANNNVPGLFLSEVLVRSDVDLDWDGGHAYNGYEAASASCDHCIDRDGDLYGDASFDIADLSSCPIPDLADCDDTDPLTKPTDTTPDGHGGTELCYDGAETCPGSVGLSVKDNDCDGLPDPVDPDCRECDNCRIELGETCDPPGTGCTASCQVEAGGTYVTELHLPTLYAGAGEQWIELYNGSATPLDLDLLGFSLTNKNGDRVSFGGASPTCAPQNLITIEPLHFYVIAFGAATQGDFVDTQLVNATCPGFTLDDQGDVLTVSTLDGPLDVVDFQGADFGCLRQNLRRVVNGETKGRSLVLAPAGTSTTQLNAQANDVASNWCLAGPNLNTATTPENPNNHYANTDNHYGSPGAIGGCAEVACDGINDDCDGDLTQLAIDADEALELIDSDGDGRCDARDCQPSEPTCTSGPTCINDVDGDGVIDCLDNCRDADGDFYGTADGLNGTCGLAPNGTPAREDAVCDDNPSINPGVAEASDGVCINGLDDDCDGAKDCRDASCSGLQICGGEVCSRAVATTCGYNGVLIANSNDFPVCDVGTVRPNSPTGADVVFSFVAPSTGTVTFAVENQGTRRHEMFISTGASSCQEASCAAVTRVGSSTCSQGGNLAVAVQQGETYFVVVKALGACNVGPLPSVRFTVSCREICGSDGQDEDADGRADCADSDCVSNALCANLDYDGDLVPNAKELACGTDPLVPTEDPLQDGFLDPDHDGVLNCVDSDDDNDNASDLAEVASCLDPLSKNDPTHHPLLDVCPGGAPSCGAAGQPACGAVGVDANCNGEVDSTEFHCGTLEANCGNNRDDDTDGYTDCADRDCVPVSLCTQQDFDSDGVSNYVEIDCNTDPYLAASKPTGGEELDPDGDGIPSCKDTDDDGDGFDDDQETLCGSDPRDATNTPPDLDGDFQCDDVDPDDDGDTFADTLELNCASDPRDANSRPNDATHDVDGDGQCNNVDVDDDGDGWNDIAEIQCSTDPLDPTSNPTALGQDVDNDRICDVLDDDDDNDGWLDADETACGNDPNDASSTPVDTDGDSVCNALDGDDDADNVPDDVEIGCNTNPLDPTSYPIEEAAQDPDHDGQPNCIDSDDDGDGLSDANEATLGSDRLNKDSDGDGIEDGQEDANDDGVIGPTETSPVMKDTDQDGLDDNVELASAYPTGTGDASAATLPYDPDTDGDGLLDGYEDADHSGSLSPGETNPVRADTDGDGASDGEEVRCATRPLDAFSVPTDKDQDGECDGAQADTDGDTVPDGVETFCGTDPLSNSSVPSLADLEDTDDDGVINCVDTDDDDDTFADVDEIECGNGPRNKDDRPTLDDVRDYDGDGALNCSDADDDNDGVSDVTEATKGTDPQDRDSDDDGLSDGRELDLGTDPLDPDSDDDGVQDGTEVGEVGGTVDTDEAIFQPDLDPTTTTDPRRADTDGDGLAEGLEDTNANGRVDEGEGDPLDPRDGNLDTDGDGLIDRDEINIHHTDPENKDTDGDALDDKLEVDVWFTDPLVGDTDGGGVVDGFEVENGTNPLEPGDDFTEAVVRGDSVFNCSGGQSAGAAAGFILMLILGFSWLIRLRRRGGVR